MRNLLQPSGLNIQITSLTAYGSPIHNVEELTAPFVPHYPSSVIKKPQLLTVLQEFNQANDIIVPSIHKQSHSCYKFLSFDIALS